MKYEIIKNAHVKEIVRMNGVEMKMRKALSEVIINNKTIFQAVEQGFGFRNKDIFVYYHPEHKKLVLQWFNELFMKGIALKHQHEIETFILK